MTTFLDKCVYKLDFSNRKLKPRSDLVVFIITDNVYDAYTPEDIKMLIYQPLKRIRDYAPKNFIELPSGIMIESSFINYFENKEVTFRLKSYNNFENKDVMEERLPYYNALPVFRTEIGGELGLVINESEIETDEDEIKIQKERRRDLKNLRFKQDEEENQKNPFSFINLCFHGYDIWCEKFYTSRFLKYETWFKKGCRHREGDLPAEIIYYENEDCQEEDKCLDLIKCIHRSLLQPGKAIEKWYKNEELCRENGKPDWIEYYRNGSVKSVQWIDLANNKTQLEEQSKFEYYPLLYCFTDLEKSENSQTEFGISKSILGSKKSESWRDIVGYDRNGDKPAYIEYYENGNKKEEAWYQNHRLKRIVEHDENGNKIERWFQITYG